MRWNNQTIPYAGAAYCEVVVPVGGGPGGTMASKLMEHPHSVPVLPWFSAGACNLQESKQLIEGESGPR